MTSTDQKRGSRKLPGLVKRSREAFTDDFRERVCQVSDPSPGKRANRRSGIGPEEATNVSSKVTELEIVKDLFPIRSEIGNRYGKCGGETGIREQVRSSVTINEKGRSEV